MVRAIGTLAFFFLLAFIPPARAQDARAPDRHIRSGDADLIDALAGGAAASPTLRALVDHVEASDVVVYLEWRPSPDAGVAARTAFISSAGGRRYLSVSIDPRYACRLVALLGHELQHVAEIADEAGVVSERSLAAFYRRVGFDTGGWARQRFESQAALEAGDRVTREARASESAASRAR